MTGVLYGVGVGPGDPELMTLKAHRLISNAAVVAYLAADSSAGPKAPRARRIAADAIQPGATEIEIRVPMRAARAAAQAAYDHGAARIAAELDAGRDVVVLCEGDPLFYGSFMYLLARLAPRYHAEITPGVPSPLAAASVIGRPLTARDEPLAVIPATAPRDQIEARLAEGGSAAIMKLGRRLAEIRDLVHGLNLTERAFYIENATEPNERWTPLKDAPPTAPYFSMILIVSADAFAAGAATEPS